MTADHAERASVADWPSDLMAPVALTPEENQVFRLARTLLLLSVADSIGKPVTSLDRVGFYDFFADSPFIIVDGDSARDDGDRLALELAGFEPNRLDYASSGARFTTRRRQLQHDIALLISRGLVTITDSGYEPTSSGDATAAAMMTAYADAYRTSAEVVIRRLGNLSGTALERTVDQKLGESWLLVDLLADVQETTIPERPRVAPRVDADTPADVGSPLPPSEGSADE